MSFDSVIRTPVAVLARFLVLVVLVSGCDKHPLKPPVPEPEPSTDPFANPPSDARLYGIQAVSQDGSPLAGASVAIEANRRTFGSATDGNGWAYVTVPNSVDLPDRVILMVNHAQALPVAILANGARTARQRGPITCPRLEGTQLLRDFHLHHLGDDNFGGSANSELQMPSEGLEYSGRFDLASAPTRMPRMRFYARGIERPVQVLINGQSVGTIPTSDGNGGLTLYDGALPGSPAIPHAGTNTITIRTVLTNGDYDDIEFCNLVLAL